MLDEPRGSRVTEPLLKKFRGAKNARMLFADGQSTRGFESACGPQRKRMHALAGKKRCRRSLGPCSMRIAIVRRERMTALPRRHVEISVLFAPGRDGEALRRTEGGRLHARHVGVTR